MNSQPLLALLPLLPAAVICGSGLVALLGRLRIGPQWRALLWAIALFVSLVPIGGVSPAMWIRGVIGDLSIPSMILLAAATAGLLLRRPLLAAADKRWLAALFSLCALLLYPLALGLARFDPYSLGYHPTLLAPAILLLAAAAIVRGRKLVACILAAAMLAWSFTVLESTNLWDYLIDPCLAVYTLAIGSRLIVARFTGPREDPLTEEMKR